MMVFLTHLRYFRYIYEELEFGMVEEYDKDSVSVTI